MPRFRATVSGPDLAAVDGILREARVGVVVNRDVDDGTTASGVPTERPETQSVGVSIDGEDAADAERKVTEALPDGYSVTILDN